MYSFKVVVDLNFVDDIKNLNTVEILYCVIVHLVIIRLIIKLVDSLPVGYSVNY